MYDAVVVEGGVIGCAVARELALRGLDVAVVERDLPATHASWAAAGMLSPLAEADRADPFLDVLRQSRARFTALATALHGETGLDVAYRDGGTLLVALREEDEPALQARWRWQSAADLPVERLSASEARRGRYPLSVISYQSGNDTAPVHHHR